MQKNQEQLKKVTICGLPVDILPRLKAACALRGITIGQAVTQAIEKWLQEEIK